MKLAFEIPIRTQNTSNLREHWGDTAKRAKSQRRAVAYRFPKAQVIPLLVVVLTRIAPRTLDPGDNLASALKSVRDEVATQLGMDDRSRLVRWVYRQMRGEDGVRVEIQPMPPMVCPGCSEPICDCAGLLRSTPSPQEGE